MGIPQGRTCISANAVLKAIICGTTKNRLIDYTTDEKIKKKVARGYITPDGKYILTTNDGYIEEIATGKIIDLSTMDDNDHFIFAMDYPTRPKPDGTIAFQLLNERGADSGFIGEANLNDRLKLNGQGFKYTIIENVGNWYGQVKNSSGYYGKGRYVWGSEGLSNNLVNWEKNIFLSCDVSHDGNWIVCSMNPDNTKKTGWVLINTRERKVVKHWPNLKAKNAIWVWVGSVEQHPGFVR